MKYLLIMATAIMCATGPGWAQTSETDDGNDAMESDATEMVEDSATMADGPASGGSGMMDDGAMSDEMADGGMEGMEGMEPPDPLFVYFDSGSARIAPDQQDVLDRAVRTFRDGDWIVIEVSGVADTVGDPVSNLRLSMARAQNVADALIARGIDPIQLQYRARGNSELVVTTDDATAASENRVAEITWR